MIVVIKYNAGNIQSVLYSLERIGVVAEVSDDPGTIRRAEKVIFPGVGQAGSAMNYLKERNLDNVIRNLKQPVLGICLGMQLLCNYSEENETGCLGIFDERVKRFEQGSRDGDVLLKVPQIGWNNIYNLKTDLFIDIRENSYCYFVHSYYASIGPHTIATTNYTGEYSSALQKDNFYGVQFHPEKSAETGVQILKNFLKI